MKIVVDRKLCSGHARCAAVAPDVYELDADGYNVTGEKDVPEALREQAMRGLRACPERAITVDEG